MEKTNLEKLEIMKLRTNGNKLHQTDARKYKDKLHDLFSETIRDLGLIVTMVDNGFIIEMPHEEQGAIPIEAKFIVKPLDYDILSASEMYQMKLDKQEKKK